MDVGDETVDACIYAGRLRPVHITCCRNHMGQGLKIGETACVCGIRRIAADTLEVIALEIELARFEQSLFGEFWVFPHQRIAKRWPIAFILPARIRHEPIEIVE